MFSTTIDGWALLAVGRNMETTKVTDSAVLRISHKSAKVIALSLAGVFFTLVVSLAASLYFMKLNLKDHDKSNEDMRSRLDSIQTLVVIGNQFLISSVDYATERQRLILFSRDMILASKGNEATREDAFKIARANVRECELYPNIDPLLILAQQWQETGGRFNKNLVNKKSGATGLMQVLPTTALDLWDGFFKSKYDNVLLKDIDINIKIGTRYIANRHSVYKNYGAALAYYNGGHVAARMYTEKDNSLYSETAKYVPTVINKWNYYTEKFKTYNMPTSSLVNPTIKKELASTSSPATQEN